MTNCAAENFSFIGSFLLALGFGLVLLPFYIKWLREKQVGQFIREEGPAAHASKAKTPTMGGVGFIAAIILVWVVFSIRTHQFYGLGTAALVLALLCGGIGFLDDSAKIRNKANAGVSASLRLNLEIVFGLTYGFILTTFFPVAQKILVPVIGEWQLPYWLFFLLVVFVIAATTNAVNLHDGMDGLSPGTTALVLLTMTIMLFHTQQIGLANLAAISCGAVLAFWVFNKYPAKVFMGDTGSLFLGALLAALALAGGLLFWFIPLSLIYIAETLSVILQVVYFKLTKPYKPKKPMNPIALIWLKLTKRLPGEGKRLFKMAPLHHHFEIVMAKKNIPEWQVVAGFWLIQALICVGVLAAFFLL